MGGGFLSAFAYVPFMFYQEKYTNLFGSSSEISRIRIYCMNTSKSHKQRKYVNLSC